MSEINSVVNPIIDQQLDGVDAPLLPKNESEKQKESERIHLNFKEYQLGNAVGFRVKLDIFDQQTDVIVALRNNGIMAWPDDQQDVLGYLRSKEDLQNFIDVTHRYDGYVGLGASWKDSQVMIVEERLTDDQEPKIDKHRTPILATSSATNGAARAANHDELKIRTQELTLESKAYRYWLHGDSELQHDVLTVGDKATQLGGVAIGNVDLPDKLDLRELGEQQQEVYQHLTGEYLALEETFNDASSFFVLSIDIKGFSSTYHDFIRNAEKEKAGQYLKLVTAFLLQLEYNAKKLVQQEHPDADCMGIEQRGDSGGVIFNQQYEKQVIEAYLKTLEQYPGFEVRASVLKTENSKFMVSSSGALIPKKMDELIKVIDANMKEEAQKHAEKGSVLKDGSGKTTFGIQPLQQETK